MSPLHHADLSSPPGLAAALAGLAMLATVTVCGLAGCDRNRPEMDEPSLAERVADATAVPGGAETPVVPGTPAAPPLVGPVPPGPGDRASAVPPANTSLLVPPPAPTEPERTELPSVETLQAAVIALGDEIVDLVVVATDEIEDNTTDAADRRTAHEIKLAVARTVTNTVAGPSPFAALVDLVTKTTLLSRAAEVAAPTRFGADGQVLINAFHRARDKSQAAAARLMTRTQAADLAAALSDATLTETDLVFVAQISVREYVAGFGVTGATGGDQRQRRRLNLLSLLAIDPLANLDPTTRELQQSRLLAERVLYQAQRTGRILRWEVEGLLYDLLGAPETQNVLASVDRASRTSQTVADTVAELPEVIASERAAAIEQLDQLVTQQRTALLADTEALIQRQREAAIDDLQTAVAAERLALREDVQAVEGPLVRTMESSRATIEEATRLSESLDQTLRQFDGLMARLGVDAQAPEDPADGDTGDEGRPFDITEYGKVARDLTGAANELTTTLRAFESVLGDPLLTPTAGGEAGEPQAANARIPAAIALQETGTALLNGLLVRGVVLILLAGATILAVILVLRRNRTAPAPSPQKPRREVD